MPASVERVGRCAAAGEAVARLGDARGAAGGPWARRSSGTSRSAPPGSGTSAASISASSRRTTSLTRLEGGLVVRPARARDRRTGAGVAIGEGAAAPQQDLAGFRLDAAHAASSIHEPCPRITAVISGRMHCESCTPCAPERTACAAPRAPSRRGRAAAGARLAARAPRAARARGLGAAAAPLSSAGADGARSGSARCGDASAGSRASSASLTVPRMSPPTATGTHPTPHSSIVRRRVLDRRVGPHRHDRHAHAARRRARRRRAPRRSQAQTIPTRFCSSTTSRCSTPVRSRERRRLLDGRVGRAP